MPSKKPSIAILGMSPGNSYFKEDIIRNLIGEVNKRFEGIRIMIPDYPAQYTFRATGESRPESKARLKGNNLRNKISNIIGLDEQRLITIDWKKQINNSPEYKRNIREILTLYGNNTAFRDAARANTRAVLLGGNIGEEVAEEKVEIGVKFLLCELAFLTCAKEILGSEVTYIYHRPWPIFSDFIAGKFDGKIRDIGFEVIS